MKETGPRFVLLLLIQMGPADGAAARAPYEGVWSERAEWCRMKPPQTGDYPVRIERKGWSGYEYFCDFKSIRRNGSSFTIRAECGGESEAEVATLRMRRVGEALFIADPAGKFRSHVRCRVCDDKRRDNSYPCRAMPVPPGR
jgi:hypothetical protein